MRVSVKNSDPGYFPGSFLCSVYLDGVKLDDCVTADEEEGIAICYDLATPHRYGVDIPLVTRHGRVLITTRDKDGRCVFCGASGAAMHRDDCPRHVPDVFGSPDGADAINLTGCITKEQAKRALDYRRALDSGKYQPFVLAGDDVRVDKVMIGDNDVTHLVDGKEVAPPGYVAVRIKASDPCPACERTDGHDADCPMDHLQRMMDSQAALERGEGVAIRIDTKGTEGSFTTTDTLLAYDASEACMDQRPFVWADKQWRVLNVAERERDVFDISLRVWKPETIAESRAALEAAARDLCRSVGISDRMIDQMLSKPLSGDEFAKACGLPEPRIPTEADQHVHRAIAAMQSGATNRKANEF